MQHIPVLDWFADKEVQTFTENVMAILTRNPKITNHLRYGCNTPW